MGVAIQPLRVRWNGDVIAAVTSGSPMGAMVVPVHAAWVQNRAPIRGITDCGKSPRRGVRRTDGTRGRRRIAPVTGYGSSSLADRAGTSPATSGNRVWLRQYQDDQLTVRLRSATPGEIRGWLSRFGALAVSLSVFSVTMLRRLSPHPPAHPGSGNPVRRPPHNGRQWRQGCAPCAAGL